MQLDKRALELRAQGKGAPLTMQVHGRQVNVEHIPAEPSMYGLAREWLVGSPHRPMAARASGPPLNHVQLPPPLPRAAESSTRLLPAKRPRQELRETVASPGLILDHHVQRCRDVRAWAKVRRRRMLERFRPRLLKLLCGGQGLSDAHTPMPVQLNQIELGAVPPGAEGAVASEGVAGGAAGAGAAGAPATERAEPDAAQPAGAPAAAVAENGPGGAGAGGAETAEGASVGTERGAEGELPSRAATADTSAGHHALEQPLDEQP